MAKEIFRVELPLSYEERKEIHDKAGVLDKPRSLVNFYLTYNADAFESLLNEYIEELELKMSKQDLETLTGKTVRDALSNSVRRAEEMLDTVKRGKLTFYEIMGFLEDERNFLRQLTENEEFMVDAADYYIKNGKIDASTYFHHVIRADIKKIKEKFPGESYLVKDYMKGKDEPFRMTSKRRTGEGYYNTNELEKIIIDFMRPYFDTTVDFLSRSSSSRTKSSKTFSMVNHKGRLLLKTDNKALEIFALSEDGTPVKLDI